MLTVLSLLLTIFTSISMSLCGLHLIPCSSSELLAESLAQGAHIERPVRCGSLTVMTVGQPRIDLLGFHSAELLYPHKYRATRIHWSIHRPMHRTLYLFEVRGECEIVMEMGCNHARNYHTTIVIYPSSFEC
jgi:hypothetical protein